VRSNSEGPTSYPCSQVGIGDRLRVATTAVTGGRINRPRKRGAELQLQVVAHIRVQVNLQGVVMRVGLLFRQPDRTIAQVLVGLVDAGAARLDQSRQIAGRREIDFPVIVLMPALAADVGQAQNRSGSQSLLNADTVLGARRRLVSKGNAGNADGKNRQIRRAYRAAGAKVETRIGERNVGQRGAGIKGSVRGPVVHIVALNAVVHDAKSAADDRLALAREVIGKTDAWPEGRPVVVGQTLGDSVLTSDPDAVFIELQSRQDRV
jgi:hypothetical protein